MLPIPKPRHLLNRDKTGLFDTGAHGTSTKQFVQFFLEKFSRANNIHYTENPKKFGNHRLFSSFLDIFMFSTKHKTKGNSELFLFRNSFYMVDNFLLC